MPRRSSALSPKPPHQRGNFSSASSYEEVFGKSRYCKPVPKYVVDLRLSPKDRWAKLKDVVDLQECLCNARRCVDDVASSFGLPPVATSSNPAVAFLRGSLFLFMQFLLRFSLFKEDIIALADCFGISPGELFFANLLYELMGGCTSIVCEESTTSKSTSGPLAPRLLHGRTMDWPFNSLAKSTLHFVWLAADDGVNCEEGESGEERRGTATERRRVFQSLGWPGFAGVLTGVKPGRFSICLNARYPVYAPGRVAVFIAALFDSPATASGQIASTGMADRLAWLSAAWRRLISACTGGWQASSVIRHALENAQSYDAAVEFVRGQQLVVPSYFSVVSGDNHQGLAGAVITHSTVNEECSIERLGAQSTAAAFLVQTNDDAEILRRAVDAERGNGNGDGNSNGGSDSDSNAPADFYSKERYCAVLEMFKQHALKKEKNQWGHADSASPHSLSQADMGRLLASSLRNGGVRMGITLHACVMVPAETAEDTCLVATRMTRSIGSA